MRNLRLLSCRGRPFQKTTISRAEMPVSISHSARKLSSSMSSLTSNVNISSESVVTVSLMLPSSVIISFNQFSRRYFLETHRNTPKQTRRKELTNRRTLHNIVFK